MIVMIRLLMLYFLFFNFQASVALDKKSDAISIQYITPTTDISISFDTFHLTLKQSERGHHFKIKSDKACMKQFVDFKNNLSKTLLIPLAQNKLLIPLLDQSNETFHFNNKKYSIKPNQKMLNLRNILSSTYKKGLLLKSRCEEKE